jgi:hypothetical protein
MLHNAKSHVPAAAPRGRDQRAHRLRELAEAGAAGRTLTPSEIREVCEAFRAHQSASRTNFHSGVG